MKAIAKKIIQGEGFVECPLAEATHVTINIPGPSSYLTLPIILKGSRDDQPGVCWSWNGDTEKPTLKPSIKTESPKQWLCHTHVNDGMVHFLDDCTHALRGQTIALLDIEPGGKHWNFPEEPPAPICPRCNVQLMTGGSGGLNLCPKCKCGFNKDGVQEMNGTHTPPEYCI